MKTAVIRELKVEKSFPRWEMNGLSEGYERRSLNGPLTEIGVVWQKLDFLAETQDFGPKNSVHFLILTMFWPSQKKLFKEKSWLFPNKYHYLKKFWVFFLVKMHFWPKKHFSAERKNGCFSVIPARTGSVVNLGHFFYDGKVVAPGIPVICPVEKNCDYHTKNWLFAPIF